ncbi:MAG: hypothetical protein LBK58_09045 [Prevotellaceae bacterium]|jgi:hypothetical protein|nr:hypothetical protein [Prevotellaceae bacterium]
MKRINFMEPLFHKVESGKKTAWEINENSRTAKKIERIRRQVAALANEINSKAREAKK